MIAFGRPRRGAAARTTAVFLFFALASGALLASNRYLPAMLSSNSLSSANVLLESWLNRGADELAAFTTNVARFRTVYSDNQQLRLRNRELEARVAQLQALQAENEQLRRALDFDRTYGGHFVTAGVIGRSPDPFDRTLVIDRGRSTGIQAGMVVVTAMGLVGRITDVSPASATVETVVDPSARVNAFGSSSGLEGTVIGTDSSMLDVEVQPRFGSGLQAGEWMLTSGVGGQFPRGIAVGQVTAVDKPDSAALQSAQIGPAVDVTSVTVVQVMTDFHPQ